MVIETFTGDYQPWAGTDLATSTFTVLPAAQLAEPVASATRAIIDLGGVFGSKTDGNILDCLPLMTTANNVTMTGVRVYGWSRVAGSSGTLGSQWEATLLFELAMTAGNLPGPSGGIFGATYFRPDTITLVNPTTAPNWLEVFNPVLVTADLPGWFRFDAKGFRKVETTCDLGTATAYNCLVRKY